MPAIRSISVFVYNKHIDIGCVSRRFMHTTTITLTFEIFLVEHWLNFVHSMRRILYTHILHTLTNTMMHHRRSKQHMYLFKHCTKATKKNRFTTEMHSFASNKVWRIVSNITNRFRSILIRSRASFTNILPPFFLCHTHMRVHTINIIRLNWHTLNSNTLLCHPFWNKFLGHRNSILCKYKAFWRTFLEPFERKRLLFLFFRKRFFFYYRPSSTKALSLNSVQSTSLEWHEHAHKSNRIQNTEVKIGLASGNAFNVEFCRINHFNTRLLPMQTVWQRKWFAGKKRKKKTNEETNESDGSMYIRWLMAIALFNWLYLLLFQFSQIGKFCALVANH